MKIKTKYGIIEGVTQDNVELFWGIPYAKADRFCPPVKPDAWDGGLPCAHPRARCIQSPASNLNPFFPEFYKDTAYMPAMSENCQYLNVRTPDVNGKLPVAVYIHGGGFGGGYNSEIEFDSNAIPKQGIVLVTINYRLNVFGFFASPELTKEQGASGNYGILDQLEALRWVQENIADFGGDPNNVTIFGQSAGAMSVQTLVCSPLTRGLVHHAIPQSGGGYLNGFNRNRTLREAEEKGTALIEFGGFSSVKELRALSAEELFDLNSRFVEEEIKKYGFGAGLMYCPTTDGVVLPKPYDEIIAAGQTLDIDYMLGSTENDLTCTPEQLIAGEPSPLHMGNIAFVNELEKQGRKPGYVYFFNRRLPGDGWGAFHSSELWYMFGSLDKCWRPMTEADYALSERMVRDWTNFMKTGNPGFSPCRIEEPYVEKYNCGETGGYDPHADKKNFFFG